MADVRFHNYYIDIPTDNFVWARNFSQFPGLPGIYPGETFVLENAHGIIRATNSYWHWSIYLSLGYIALTFSLKFLMSKREKGFDLKRELIIWNWILAIFSAIGVVRCLPEFVHILTTRGFVASYTENTYVEDIRVNAWYLAFTLSKAPELMDTLFIVLRKGRLINLHWIHHTLTLIYSWFVFGDMPSTARWMVNMNFFVHTLMYTYYAVKISGYYVPRKISVGITTLQIAQMFFGLYINYKALQLKLLGLPCDTSLSVVLVGFTLYGLFAVLFINFFVYTYVIRKSGRIFFSAPTADKNNNTLKCPVTMNGKKEQ